MAERESLFAALDLIAAERKRQVEQENWTLEHDDFHRSGGLAKAAAVYALPDEQRELRLIAHGLSRQPFAIREWLWPWDDEWFKPTPEDRERELVKAGALIVAEIERLRRAS